MHDYILAKKQRVGGVLQAEEQLEGVWGKP